MPASRPPPMAQMQQQALMSGRAESTPTISPPSSAGFNLLFIAPVLANRALIVNKIADICRQSYLEISTRSPGCSLGSSTAPPLISLSRYKTVERRPSAPRSEEHTSELQSR